MRVRIVEVQLIISTERRFPIITDINLNLIREPGFLLLLLPFIDLTVNFHRDQTSLPCLTSLLLKGSNCSPIDLIPFFHPLCERPLSSFMKSQFYNFVFFPLHILFKWPYSPNCILHSSIMSLQTCIISLTLSFPTLRLLKILSVLEILLVHLNVTYSVLMIAVHSSMVR